MTKIGEKTNYFYRLSLYGELKVLLGTRFSKKSKKFFSIFVIRRFEWHIGGEFSEKSSKTFSLTPQLENKMPFGPLFEKKLIIFISHPKLTSKSKCQPNSAKKFPLIYKPR